MFPVAVKFASRCVVGKKMKSRLISCYDKEVVFLCRMFRLYESMWWRMWKRTYCASTRCPCKRLSNYYLAVKLMFCGGIKLFICFSVEICALYECTVQCVPLSMLCGDNTIAIYILYHISKRFSLVCLVKYCYLHLAFTAAMFFVSKVCTWNDLTCFWWNVAVTCCKHCEILMR